MSTNRMTDTRKTELEAAIGSNNFEYYKECFSKFDDNGGKLSTTWNWSAFFFSVLWLAYRRMRRYAWSWVGFVTFLIFVCSFLPLIAQLWIMAHFAAISWSLLAIVSVYFALYSDGFYYQIIGEKIQRAYQLYPKDDEKRLLYISKGSGTNVLLVIYMIVIIYLTTGMAASIFLSDISLKISIAKGVLIRHEITVLCTLLDTFRLDVGRYPTNEEGLAALYAQPASAKNWKGPYILTSKHPKDPYGSDYQYRFPGEHGPYDVFSLGEDNAYGGIGFNEDIVSWEICKE